MILIPREVCVDPEQALDKEWLVTNGIGGYASSSIIYTNTRRYHGLLVAALRPPVERTVLLATMNEEAEMDDRIYYLGTNEYSDGKIHPGGFVHIEEFSIRDGVPSALFRMGDNLLQKTIWMEHGHNTTYIRYSYLEGTGECCLVLHPMCNYRNYHGMTKGVFDWDFGVETYEGGCKVTAHGNAVPFWLSTYPVGAFTHTGVWYWNFVYRREVERGYTEREDLYLPGVIRVVLQPGDEVIVTASTEPPDSTTHLVEDAYEREIKRQKSLLANAGIDPGADEQDAADPDAPLEAFQAQLVRAADSFIVSRRIEKGGVDEEVPTVIAGYHWFADWGRDTMIALPGLTLPTGRGKEAEETLRAFSLFLRDGLLPNNFPDIGSEPHYNTVDATLWMFRAIERLQEATGNNDLARELLPALESVINWHLKGTSFGIGVDPKDGLLRAGEPGVQLTWMDARVEDWVVTPRTGKAVEINALWYNALRMMERIGNLDSSVGDKPAIDYSKLAAQVRESFRERFWFESGGYLYDVVDGPDGDDASLRPNQLIALSMPDLLPQDRAKEALDVVKQHLFTPYGLRTLPSDDSRYVAIYVGTRRERDAAYHNGTVWAWLLGPYFDAVRVIEGEETAGKEMASILPYLRAHMAEAGLGSISEIFDADAPHTPKGCVSQAWSVSEVLRLVTTLLLPKSNPS